MNETHFTVPKGLSHKEMAHTFNAYLAGAHVGLKMFKDVPFRKRGSRENWVLDHTNDFWLYFKGDGTARLSCRYDSQLPIVQAMTNLFTVMFQSSEVVKEQSAA